MLSSNRICGFIELFYYDDLDQRFESKVYLCILSYFHLDLLIRQTGLNHCVWVYCIIFDVISLHVGTDINDKLRSSLNTPALMKMLNTSEAGDLATPRMEDTNVTSLETPLSDQDKMMLETPLRTSLTLECDMYESDVMLDTLSDTSTWSHPATRWNWRSKRFSEINMNKIMDTVPHHPSIALYQCVYINVVHFKWLL